MQNKRQIVFLQQESRKQLLTAISGIEGRAVSLLVTNSTRHQL